MKTIIDNYTFNPTSKTITFNDPGIIYNKIQQVKNLTTGPIIYAAWDTTGAIGGTFASNVLTFTASTSGMASTDQLQIIYDSPDNISQQGDLTELKDSVATRGMTASYDNLSVASGATADLLGPTYVGKYSSIFVHITAVSTGAFIQISFSPDGTSNWSVVMTVGSGGFPFPIPRVDDYMKVSVTVAGTSGATTGSVKLYSEPFVGGYGRSAFPVPPYVQYVGMQDNSGGLAPLYSLAGVGDSASGNKPLGVGMVAFNGQSSTRARVADTFKSITASTTGTNTVIWTPTTGKKFRLLAYRIDLTQNASKTATGTMVVGLQDATTGFGISHTVFVPTTAGTTMGSGWTTGWVDLGPLGKLSSTANNALGINLSATLNSGVFSVMVAGTEE